MKSIFYLGLSNLFSFSIITLMVTCSALIGMELAPSPEFATVAITLQVSFYAGSVYPTNRLMQRFGRRSIILGANALGLGALSIIAYAVTIQSYVLFCVGSALLGSAMCHILQFRFIAIESVDASNQPKALTMVMLAGVGAAFLGPELATYGIDLFDQRWLGSFMFAILALSISTVTLYKFLPQGSAPVQTTSPLNQPKSWSTNLTVIVAAAAAGGGLMSFIMTATPITMHHHSGYSLEMTKQIIQWHIVAMFAPSLVSKQILQCISKVTMLRLGTLLILSCAVLSLTNSTYTSFAIALILLGVGWNFLFTGSTLYLNELADPEQRLRQQGIMDGVSATTQAVATMMAGVIVAGIGWNIVLISSTIIATLLLMLLMFAPLSRLTNA